MIGDYKVAVVGIGSLTTDTTWVSRAAERAGTIIVIISNSTSTFDSNATTMEPRSIKERLADIIKFNASRDRLKKLNAEEAELLSAYNVEPTTNGIRSCEARHSAQLCRMRFTPPFRARFDRRLPCWRSTRWKSLT